LTLICTKSFVGWGFAPIATDPLGELTAFLAVLSRPTSKGRGEKGDRRGGSSSFALGRKKPKVGAYALSDRKDIR